MTISFLALCLNGLQDLIHGRLDLRLFLLSLQSRTQYLFGIIRLLLLWLWNLQVAGSIKVSQPSPRRQDLLWVLLEVIILHKHSLKFINLVNFLNLKLWVDYRFLSLRVFIKKFGWLRLWVVGCLQGRFLNKKLWANHNLWRFMEINRPLRIITIRRYLPFIKIWWAKLLIRRRCATVRLLLRINLRRLFIIIKNGKLPIFTSHSYINVVSHLPQSGFQLLHLY